MPPPQRVPTPPQRVPTPPQRVPTPPQRVLALRQPVPVPPKVAGAEAFRAWRLLLLCSHGEPAPGPGPGGRAPDSLRVFPSPTGLGVDSVLGVASRRGRERAGTDDHGGGQSGAAR